VAAIWCFDLALANSLGCLGIGGACVDNEIEGSEVNQPVAAARGGQ